MLAVRRRGPRRSRSRGRRPAPRTSGRSEPATPSNSTVQAPQTPCSQPTWVPASKRSWRRKSLSSNRASDLRRYGVPFTVTLMSWLSVAMPRPLVGRVAARARSARRRDGAEIPCWHGCCRPDRQRAAPDRPLRRSQACRYVRPTRDSLAAAAKIGVSPALHSPMRAMLQRSSSSRPTVQATPMMAKSPRRRDISRKQRRSAVLRPVVPLPSASRRARAPWSARRQKNPPPRSSVRPSPTARATCRRAPTRWPAFPRPGRHATDCRRWFRDCGFAGARCAASASWISGRLRAVAGSRSSLR